MRYIHAIIAAILIMFVIFIFPTTERKTSDFIGGVIFLAAAALLIMSGICG